MQIIKWSVWTGAARYSGNLELEDSATDEEIDAAVRKAIWGRIDYCWRRSEGPEDMGAEICKAEIYELESLLADLAGTPDENVLDRMSLEARLAKVKSEQAQKEAGKNHESGRVKNSQFYHAVMSEEADFLKQGVVSEEMTKLLGPEKKEP